MHPLDKERPELDKTVLYAQLGLTAQASDQDIEAAHKELVSFLESAPDGVRRWAQSEIAAADEAYALLSEPAIVKNTRPSPPVNRFAAGAVALVVVIAVIVAVYNVGGGRSGSEAKKTEKDQAASLSLTDQARIARLMKKVEADPKDVTSRIKLGDIYFKAGDYKSAGGWMDQAVKIDPKNVTALLALGAVQFNLNGIADARRQWLRVIAIDPKNVEAYYDLGFLYLSQKPPDKASARAAWKKVVELAPKSSVARTVADHLKSLKVSPEPTSSASGK